MRSAARGFTLIELVIVVALVAILAAVALPAYTSQIRKSNRAAGKATLSQVLQREEAFVADRKRYATVLGPTGLGLAADTIYACRDGNLDCTASTGIYEITICSSGTYFSSSGASITCAAANATTTVWLKATPINTQAQDSCGTLVVNTVGVKGQTQNSSLCWRG